MVIAEDVPTLIPDIGSDRPGHFSIIIDLHFSQPFTGAVTKHSTTEQYKRTSSHKLDEKTIK